MAALALPGLPTVGTNHINVLGRYRFSFPEPIACRELREYS